MLCEQFRGTKYQSADPNSFSPPGIQMWGALRSFCWLQCSLSGYYSAQFFLLLGWLSNNSYPGEDGAKSSFVFWSEGRQFNWKCKLRSRVSPQWFEALAMLMCAVHRRMKEGWWQGANIMVCVRFPCLPLMPSVPHAYPSYHYHHRGVILAHLIVFHSIQEAPAACSSIYVHTAGFLFRGADFDTVTSAAFSWRMEAASHLVSFFAFHSPCCWPGVCREKPHHRSLLPATLTLVDALARSHLWVHPLLKPPLHWQ